LIKQRVPGARVVGIDGDPKILLAKQKAQKNGVNIVFDHGVSTSLPYGSATFDRVLSSLVLHHPSHEDKVRTVLEVFRVLKPGGEFHVADWGKPQNALMRALFVLVRSLDGFENTRDNVQGNLPELFMRGGFGDVELRTEFATVFGTMALYAMKKARVV
jgi:SAM-dependent methyltransferase